MMEEIKQGKARCLLGDHEDVSQVNMALGPKKHGICKACISKVGLHNISGLLEKAKNIEHEQDRLETIRALENYKANKFITK